MSRVAARRGDPFGHRTLRPITASAALGASVALTLIALGSGGIKPCVSSHVGDQFGPWNQPLLSRAFGWFYFSVNFGSFFSILLIPCVAVAWLMRMRIRAGSLRFAVVLAVAVLCVAPWTIRNELRLHAFVPVASYTWLNLWEVNNPSANGHFVRPERTIPDEVRRIRGLPEIQQDNEWRRLALSWLSAHPSKAAIGRVRDVGLFFKFLLAGKKFCKARPQTPPR